MPRIRLLWTCNEAIFKFATIAEKRATLTFVWLLEIAEVTPHLERILFKIVNTVANGIHRDLSWQSQNILEQYSILKHYSIQFHCIRRYKKYIYKNSISRNKKQNVLSDYRILYLADVTTDPCIIRFPDYLYLTKVHFPCEYSTLNVASVLIFISTVAKQLRDCYYCNWHKGENNSNKDSC